VVAREHLVAPSEPDRARGEVDAGSRVRNEREAALVRAYVRRQLRPCLFEQPVEPPREERGRLALQLALPLLVDGEDRRGARAKRAVVQVRPLAVEQEELAERSRPVRVSS
jgi:hypothetical protein